MQITPALLITFHTRINKYRAVALKKVGYDQPMGALWEKGRQNNDGGKLAFSQERAGAIYLFLHLIRVVVWRQGDKDGEAENNKKE